MRGLSFTAFLLVLSLFVGTLLPIVQTAAAIPCDAARLHADAAASEILKTQRPFAPANRDLFYTWERDDWADVAPISDPQGPARTEQETYQDLRAFLERRFPCSSSRVLDGLAVYINPIARQKIPDPTLRAALAALTGTLGEPAIAYLLYEAPVGTIHFGVVINTREGWPQGTPAAVYQSTDKVFEIVFDGRYRFNPFGTFSALLLHEALHVDRPPTGTPGEKPDDAGLPEEAAALSLEALVYMQMLLTDPALAHLPDAMTRSANNYWALIRLNSGVVGTDRLNLFVPGSDLNIDPLAPEPLTEFYESYGVSDDPEWNELETRGTPLLAAVLAALAEPGHTPPTEPDFDRATLEFIDQNHAIFSPGELIAVACILELDVPCP